MRAGGVFCSWFGAIALVALSSPAFASRFDCSHPGDAIQKIIRATPELSQLDFELARVFAAALARAPQRAAALRHDEANWLAERDDHAWQLLGDGAMAPQVPKELARLYRQRIEFARNIHSPDSANRSPVLAALLTAATRLPENTTSVIKALQAQGAIVLPHQRVFDSPDKVIAALPAPPDSALRKALKQYTGVANFTLVYLPSAHLGGVFNVEGTAQCMYWDMFDVRARTSVSIDSPDGGTGWCWNTQGHLALVNGLPVAMSETTGILSQQTDLEWRSRQRTKWGALRWVRIRFDRVLTLGFAGCASGVDCVAARQLALRYARLYDRCPLPSTLLHIVALTPVERSHFLRMVAFAEAAGTDAGSAAETALSEQEFQLHWATLREQPPHAGRMQMRDVVMGLPFANQGMQFAEPRFGPQPPVGSFQPASTFFPAHLDGELVLGRIGHGQIGWRQYSPWMVGFWRWKEGRLVPIAGVDVDRQNGKALFAVPMSGAPLPRSP